MAAGLEKKAGRGLYPEDLSKEDFHAILIYMLQIGKVEEVRKILNQRSVVERVSLKELKALNASNENKAFFLGVNKIYDAIYFCNKLSEKFGFIPVYAVDGKTNVATWKYTPHQGNWINGKITMNSTANGFRLPTNVQKFSTMGLPK